MAISVQRVRTVWSGAPGLPGYTNTFFSVPSPAQELIDSVRDAWTVLVADINTNVTATVEATVMNLDVLSGKFTGATAGVARTVDMTALGQALPLQVQGLIFLSTGEFVNGHELKGRWFVPGWTENDNSTGVPSSNAILKMINVVNTLIATPHGLCVYSPTHHVSADVISGSSPTHWGGLVSRRQ